MTGMKKRRYYAHKTLESSNTRTDFNSKAVAFKQVNSILSSQNVLDIKLSVKAMSGVNDPQDSDGRKRTVKDKKKTPFENILGIVFDPKAKAKPGQYFKPYVTITERLKALGDSAPKEPNYGWVDGPEVVTENVTQELAKAIAQAKLKPRVKVEIKKVSPKTGNIANNEPIKVKKLGPTLAESNPGSKLINAAARAAGLIIDDLGKMRCPPGTPAANQFTDRFGTNCFDLSPKELYDLVENLARQISQGIDGLSPSGMASRTRRWRRAAQTADAAGSQASEEVAKLREAFAAFDNAQMRVSQASKARDGILKNFMDAFGLEDSGDELENVLEVIDRLNEIGTINFDAESSLLGQEGLGQILQAIPTMRDRLLAHREALKTQLLSFMDHYPDGEREIWAERMTKAHGDFMYGVLASLAEFSLEDPEGAKKRKIVFGVLKDSNGDYEFKTNGITSIEPDGSYKIAFNYLHVLTTQYAMSDVPPGHVAIFSTNDIGTRLQQTAAINDALSEHQLWKAISELYGVDLAAAFGGDWKTVGSQVFWHEDTHVLHYELGNKFLEDKWDRDGFIELPNGQRLEEDPRTLDVATRSLLTQWFTEKTGDENLTALLGMSLEDVIAKRADLLAGRYSLDAQLGAAEAWEILMQNPDSPSALQNFEIARRVALLETQAELRANRRVGIVSSPLVDQALSVIDAQSIASPVATGEIISIESIVPEIVDYDAPFAPIRETQIPDADPDTGVPGAGIPEPDGNQIDNAAAQIDKQNRTLSQEELDEIDKAIKSKFQVNNSILPSELSGDSLAESAERRAALDEVGLGKSHDKTTPTNLKMHDELIEEHLEPILAALDKTQTETDYEVAVSGYSIMSGIELLPGQSTEVDITEFVTGKIQKPGDGLGTPDESLYGAGDDESTFDLMMNIGALESRRGIRSITSRITARREIGFKKPKQGPDSYQQYKSVDEIIDDIIPEFETDISRIISSNPYTKGKKTKKTIQLLENMGVDPEKQQEVRSMVRKALNDSPALLQFAREFGLPPIIVTDREPTIGIMSGDIEAGSSWARNQIAAYLNYEGIVVVNPNVGKTELVGVGNDMRTPEYVLRHEIGHAIDAMSIRNKDAAKVKKKAFAEYVERIQEYLKTAPDEEKDLFYSGRLEPRPDNNVPTELIGDEFELARSISDYSTVNRGEYIAEAFAHLTAPQSERLKPLKDEHVAMLSEFLGMDAVSLRNMYNQTASSRSNTGRGMRSQRREMPIINVKVPKGARGVVSKRDDSKDNYDILLPPGRMTIRNTGSSLEAEVKLQLSSDEIVDGLESRLLKTIDRNPNNSISTEGMRSLQAVRNVKRRRNDAGYDKNTRPLKIDRVNSLKKNSTIRESLRKSGLELFKPTDEFNNRNRELIKSVNSLNGTTFDKSPDERHKNYLERLNKDIALLRNSDSILTDEQINISDNVRRLLETASNEQIAEIVSEFARRFHTTIDKKPRVRMSKTDVETLLSSGDFTRKADNSSVGMLLETTDLNLGFDNTVGNSSKPIVGELRHNANDIAVNKKNIGKRNSSSKFYSEDSDIKVVLNENVSGRTAYGYKDYLKKDSSLIPMNESKSRDIELAVADMSKDSDSNIARINTLAQILESAIDSRYERFAGPMSDPQLKAYVAGGFSLSEVDSIEYPLSLLPKTVNEDDPIIGSGTITDKLRKLGLDEVEIQEFFAAGGPIGGGLNASFSQRLAQFRQASSVKEGFSRFGVKNVVFTNPDGVDIFNPNVYEKGIGNTAMGTEKILINQSLREINRLLPEYAKKVKKKRMKEAS